MDYYTLLKDYNILTHTVDDIHIVCAFSLDLNTPSPELLALQTKLKTLEVARCLDQEDFQNQKQVFHAQLTQEVKEEACSHSFFRKRGA